MSRDTSVVVAAADRLFAEAAAAYIDQQVGWRAAATAADGLQALSAVDRLRPQALLVIGDRLPRLSPSPLAREAARRWAGTTIVILGEAEQGPSHVLPTTADASAVLDALRSDPRPPPSDPSRPRSDGVARLKSLTRREREVLGHLANGLTKARIARQLRISEQTVRTHMQNLYSKLGCHSRLEVVRFAAEVGLLPPPRSSA